MFPLILAKNANLRCCLGLRRITLWHTFLSHAIFDSLNGWLEMCASSGMS